MQAIVTKFISPTNHRPSRIKAECDAGSIIISADSAASNEDAHMLAALALVRKLGWDHPAYGQKMISGDMPQRSPYAYVFVFVTVGANAKHNVISLKKMGRMAK